MNTTFSTEEGPGGLRIRLRSLNTGAQATLEPLALEAADADGGVAYGRWERADIAGEVLQAGGSCEHPAGIVQFTLEATPGEGPTCLEWRVRFAEGSFTGAVSHIVTLPGINAGPTDLDLPSIHYGINTYGTGIFPRPDPRRGFQFRADRMAQPAIHARTPGATWSYFAASEAAGTPEPELLYSLGIEPLASSQAGGNGSGLHFRAGLAAGNLLSYTMVYSISTFGADTDAARSGISTFGATIVSPENQHLDPVSTAPGLIAYGLYTGDEVCVQAGVESLNRYNGCNGCNQHELCPCGTGPPCGRSESRWRLRDTRVVRPHDD